LRNGGATVDSMPLAGATVVSRPLIGLSPGIGF
jgi:hypothetical protein